MRLTPLWSTDCRTRWKSAYTWRTPHQFPSGNLPYADWGDGRAAQPLRPRGHSGKNRTSWEEGTRGGDRFVYAAEAPAGTRPGCCGAPRGLTRIRRLLQALQTAFVAD